jgi:hypothetical protein
VSDTGVEGDAELLARSFGWFAAGADRLGSPFYAALERLLAQDVRDRGPVWRTLRTQPVRYVDDALPLRLLGGLHRMVLAGDLPELAAHYPSVGGDGDVEAAGAAVRAALDPPPAPVLDALTRPPQTNEVGRSAALVPGYLLVARETGLPLRLRELGASAGLNLLTERYRYQQDGRGWGDPASAVCFSDLWAGDGRPPLGEPARIVDRRGCDRDPLDAADPEVALTLLSYVWPDQDERFARLRAALDIARRTPPAVDRADAADWLDAQLAEPAPGVATVVYHSIFWQYLDEPTRDRIVATLGEAGRRATAAAPLAWLRLEPAERGHPAELRLATWDGSAGSGRDRLLATSGFHGGAVTWL